MAPPAASLWSVVLVAAGDSLRLRERPTAASGELDRIPPGARELVATGDVARSGSSVWYEVRWPLSQGWVNARYLAPDVDDRRFAADPRVDERLRELAEVVRRRGDLRPLASRNGLAAHAYAPVHVYPRGELDTLLRDDSHDVLGGVSCNPGEGECTYSFPELAAAGVEMLQAPDREVARNRVLDESRPTGLKGPYEVPVELRGYDFLVTKVEDEYARMDACYVYFAYENDQPVIAGFGVDVTGL